MKTVLSKSGQTYNLSKSQYLILYYISGNIGIRFIDNHSQFRNNFLINILKRNQQFSKLFQFKLLVFLCHFFKKKKLITF